jgi:5-oxoprolinase (ATP-hydrolysing) subunit C
VIEILSTGLANTVQDGGRPGFFDAGVSLCGAMDRPAFETANALLGNEANAAAIEVALFPFRLRFHADARFALAGAACPATLDGEALPPWWTCEAKAGQTLRLDPPAKGARLYVAFAGGIDVPLVLGSRSTDAKGGFGGLEGRGLNRGDRLNLGAPSASHRRPRMPAFGAAPDWLGDGEPWRAVRVLPAAEYGAFTARARETFFGTDWLVGAEANRMGYRLEGPELALSAPLELFSHGLVSGTVQVPASGLPIVQMADANTCGGYPKIAAVIEADLWKLAQAPVGARVRFTETDRPSALEAWAEVRAAVARIRARAALAL